MIPRSLRDPVGRRSILDRLAELTPEHPRRWGRMEPVQLLPHLASGLRVALGERKLEGSPPGRIRGVVLRYFAIYRLPCRKGRSNRRPVRSAHQVSVGNAIAKSWSNWSNALSRHLLTGWEWSIPVSGG